MCINIARKCGDNHNAKRSLEYGVNISFFKLLYWSARPVPANVRKRRPVYNTGRPGLKSAFARCRTSFLSRQCDVIASFSFGAWSVDVFSRKMELLLLKRIHPLFYFQVFYTMLSTTLSSPGQKRGSCGHVMASFDGHSKCARCCDKGVGDDNCVSKKECAVCNGFTSKQVIQLATPTYR